MVKMKMSYMKRQLNTFRLFLQSTKKIGRTTFKELINNREKYQNSRYEPNRKAIQDPEQQNLEK